MSSSLNVSLLHIILINNILNTKLESLNPNNIKDKDTQERILKLRLKGSLKSARMLSQISDEFFSKKELTDLFGDVADILNYLIDSYIENRLEIHGKSLNDVPEEYIRNEFNESFKDFLKKH